MAPGRDTASGVVTMSVAVEHDEGAGWPADLLDHRTVSPEQVTETARAALAAAEAALSAACSAADGDGATFADVVGRLDRAQGDLWAAYGRSAFMVRVHPDEAVRAAAHDADERMTTWQRSLALRDDVAAAVGRYATSADAQRLEGEERRLLEHWQRDLRRAGHELPPEARDEIRQITARIVSIEAAFERNVDEWSDGIDLSQDDLAGMPQSYVAGLQPGTAPGTYRVSLEYPDYYPFMESSPRRDLREVLARKMAGRAVSANKPLLEEVLELRRRQAARLAYPSWAHYRIELKMARTPERVAAFHASLFGPLQSLAGAEYAAMTRRLEADTGDRQIRTWDIAYYDHRIRAEEHGVDADEVAAYLTLEAVMGGLLTICEETFGRGRDPPAADQRRHVLAGFLRPHRRRLRRGLLRLPLVPGLRRRPVEPLRSRRHHQPRRRRRLSARDPRAGLEPRRRSARRGVPRASIVERALSAANGDR